jgi:hypothetical protein
MVPWVSEVIADSAADNLRLCIFILDSQFKKTKVIAESFNDYRALESSPLKDLMQN